MDKRLQSLRPPWISITKAMQDYARNRNNGIAVVKVLVLVNADGNPVFWGSPLVQKLEPKRIKREELEAFTKEQLITLLIETLTS